MKKEEILIKKLSEKDLIEKRKELTQEISKLKSTMIQEIIFSILLIWTIILPIIGFISYTNKKKKRVYLENELIEVEHYLSKYK